MHLLLGHREDPCCAGVLDLLRARGHPARILENPMAHPARLALRLDSSASSSSLAWDGEEPIEDGRIAGVLVRNTGWIDPSGWEPADLAYMQAETQAALLAWIWSLACPVVNRLPSALWYRPRGPLVFWFGLLRRCGLPTPAALVTNVEADARAFRRRAGEEDGHVVYGPLTSDARYLVAGDKDWRGLTALQTAMPVCLTYPHGAPRIVCVVGKRIVWDGDASAEMAGLEPALQRFSDLSGLSLVQLALAPTCLGLAVIQVEAHINLEHFGEASRKRIVEGIVDLLTVRSG